jgi:hypothetical protein
MDGIYAEPIEFILNLTRKLIIKKWQVITLSFLTFAG